MNDSPAGCRSRLTEAASSRKKEPCRRKPHDGLCAARGTASDLQRVPLSAISADFRLCSDLIQLSAVAALKSSGATLDPDTDRPLMALTFRLESGDVSLTLYAFDTESVLADVNGEIGLLVRREDAENIVDLVLEMLKTE